MFLIQKRALCVIAVIEIIMIVGNCCGQGRSASDLYAENSLQPSTCFNHAKVSVMFTYPLDQMVIWLNPTTREHSGIKLPVHLEIAGIDESSGCYLSLYLDGRFVQNTSVQGRMLNFSVHVPPRYGGDRFYNSLMRMGLSIGDEECGHFRYLQAIVSCPFTGHDVPESGANFVRFSFGCDDLEYVDDRISESRAQVCDPALDGGAQPVVEKRMVIAYMDAAARWFRHAIARQALSRRGLAAPHRATHGNDTIRTQTKTFVGWSCGAPRRRTRQGRRSAPPHTTRAALRAATHDKGGAPRRHTAATQQLAPYHPGGIQASA